MNADRFSTIASSLFVLLFSGACKPPSDSDSKAQHQFGNTTVERREFAPCNASDLRNDFVETHRYLSELKNHIVKSNPKTFTGELKSENICIVLSKIDTGIGGGAFGDSGRIEIERTSVQNAANDAELAALLCHELAHVSMQHIRTVQTGPSGEKLDFSNGKGPDRYFHELRTHDNYVREKSRLDDLTSKQKSIVSELTKIDAMSSEFVNAALPPEIMQEATKGGEGAKKAIDYLSKCSTPACIKTKELDQRKERLTKDIVELHEKHIPAQEYAVYKVAASIIPKDVFLTWAEREADEVGFELCVRSGFEVESLKAIPKRRLRQVPGSSSLDTESGCQAAIENALPHVTSTRDPYGRIHEIPLTNSSFPGKHPENCWRLFNLARESIVHANDYKPFMRNLKFAIPGGLEKAKREIREQR